MGTSEVISILALVMAIVTYIITDLKTKRMFEFTSTNSAYSDIVAWYEKCVGELSASRHSVMNADFDKTTHLANLSALIDVGRFYFPNRQTGYGPKKELPYRGNRDTALDCLVYSYQILKRDDAPQHLDVLRALSRAFTARVYAVLDPQQHNEKLERNTYLSFASLSKMSEDSEMIAKLTKGDAEAVHDLLYGSDGKGEAAKRAGQVG